MSYLCVHQCEGIEKSRSASNDSLLDDDHHEKRLPNKDFRKSELNRARYCEPNDEVFERERSTDVYKQRRNRRNDSQVSETQVS